MPSAPRSRDVHDRSGIAYAAGSALLFGASIPCAKLILPGMSAQMLAGVLYLGSGIGLGAWIMLPRGGRRRPAEARLTVRDLPWLAAVVLMGGVLGPLLLMWGLARTPASTSSLLLNLEGVLTAVLAWAVFREHVTARIAFGMACILAGGILLSWERPVTIARPWGALAIAGACLFWAADNNLTRKISGADPVQIAAIKGVAAGSMNVLLALALGGTFPAIGTLVLAGVIGLVGYGVSLVLFILGLRHLGSARTGAYFATGPFIGSAISILLLGEILTPFFLLAGTLMLFGVLLDLTDTHSHEHEHADLEHEHWHEHDAHHQHAHLPGQTAETAHSHRHVHLFLRHRHGHYPDIHHRHGHD